MPREMFGGVDPGFFAFSTLHTEVRPQLVQVATAKHLHIHPLREIKVRDAQKRRWPNTHSIGQ